MSLGKQGAYQVGPPQFVDCFGIVQLNIQVLVDALECAADLHLILELHSNLVLDERLEETMAHVSSGCVCVGRVRYVLWWNRRT